MPRKVRTNKRRVNEELTDVQSRWLNGEWLPNHSWSPEQFFEYLALSRSDKGEALWLAHGNPDTHFWRRGLDLPITLSELEHHEACWLESGAPDSNDACGGESYFIWNYYSDEEKQTLWNEHGDIESFHWEICLRRPIPKGASIDAAMVEFTTIGPWTIAA
jgi:hypothetical protein